MSTAPVSLPAGEPAPLSQAARLVNTLIAPQKTFADLGRSASWWLPWLLISVISLVFLYTIDRQVGYEQVSANEIAKSPKRTEQLEKLPADQKAKNLQISARITRIISYSSPVIALLAFAIMAGVLMGTFNLGAGASIAYKTSFAITVYASLPSVFHALLGIVALVVGGSSGSLDKEAFNIQNPVATNLAYFMNPTGNKLVYSLASALDVFMIWIIVLMGIGFAANSKVKRGAAIGIVAGWYLFWKLAVGTMGVLFS